MTRFKAALGSLNLRTNFLSWFLPLAIFVLNSAGVDVTLEGVTALIDAIGSQNIGAILTVAVLNFITPLTKIFQGGWKGIPWSQNFAVQVWSFIATGLAGIGFMFPPGAANTVWEAIATADVPLIISAVFVSFINPIIVWIYDRKKGDEPPVQTSIPA